MTKKFYCSIPFLASHFLCSSEFVQTGTWASNVAVSSSTWPLSTRSRVNCSVQHLTPNFGTARNGRSHWPTPIRSNNKAAIRPAKFCNCCSPNLPAFSIHHRMCVAKKFRQSLNDFKSLSEKLFYFRFLHPFLLIL